MPLTAPVRAQTSGSEPVRSQATKPEPPILFQKFFKSVGPRTYAAQIKEAGNANQFLVLTEGKRDESTGEIRKMRLYIYSEDFVEFFRMLHETAQWIKANPVSDEVRTRRAKFWAKKKADEKGGRQPGTSEASRSALASNTSRTAPARNLPPGNASATNTSTQRPTAAKPRVPAKAMPQRR